MADEQPEPVSLEGLSDDAQTWLTPRNDFRTVQAEALTKGYDPEAEEQGSTSPACEKELNDTFAQIDPNPYDSYETTAGGFPNADLVTDQFVQKVVDKAAFVYDAIPLQLQINLLESFRRMHLSQKQRKKHMLRHWQEQALQEEKSQELIVRLLLGQDIGKTAGTNPV
jgi:hypothetical protein